MPTILRINGWRVVIYPNDHSPAHVHVLAAEWEIVRCDERGARQVLRHVAEHQSMLMDAWRRFHGLDDERTVQGGGDPRAGEAQGPTRGKRTS